MKESENKHKVENRVDLCGKFMWHKPVLSELNIKNTNTGVGGLVVDGTAPTGTTAS